LFLVENPSDEEGNGEFSTNLNPESLTVLKGCKIEKDIAASLPEKKYQFMRQGYFCADKDSTADNPIFNRTVALKDSFAKKK
ncbi:MAG: glutamine--tRNA ligase, partial [Clostridia bacterium]|nr:glutamine--tRNA ligase [Clostridia bacterium]